MPSRVPQYFGTLTKGRIVLWCYAVWYVVNVALHFDPRLRLWITSLGLSGIIGFALLLSTRTPGVKTDGWVTFRLFLMPFCVSSFAALVKDAGYLLIFPPTLRENAIGFGAIATFLAVVTLLRRRARPSP
ncbi:MAG: hypothetical protein WCK55_13120 [Verrucomicrobiota bacterium]